MQISIIHTYAVLAESRTGSAKIEFQIRGEKKFETWISQKQFINLSNSFGSNEFSNKRRVIYGVFDGNKFVWSGFNSGRHNGAEWLYNTFKPDNDIFLNEGLYIHIPETLDANDADNSIMTDLQDD